MDEAFKALSDLTRRQILHLLREQDLHAGEIAEHFNMTKPSISYHLNALKQAGLISDQRRGQYIIYSLNKEVLQRVIRWFEGELGTLNADFDLKFLKK